MDYQASAKIKVSARLKPAKDIHIAYRDLISSTNPENFPELRQKFILSIDSAEIEFKILQDELVNIESLLNKWDTEIKQCTKQLEILEDQNLTLAHEREDIEQEKEKVDKLNEMKSIIKSEKIYNKIESTKKVQKDNKQTLEEIEKVEGTNKIRKVGLQQIVEGFEKFLLIEKPRPHATEDEDNINEDEDKYNEENEDKYEEERLDDENEDKFNEENDDQ